MGAVRFMSSLLLTLALAATAWAAPPTDYALLDGARRGQYLRRGARGPSVVALQHALAAAGSPVASTGLFGQATDAAVRSFQAANGCAVDGIVGPETVRALDRALGAVAAPAPPTPTPGAAPVVPPGSTLRRLRQAEVTPEITANAVRILRAHRQDPFGTEVPFVAGGRLYVGRIEQHYHPPGGAARPWGYHPGVSVLAVITP